MRRLQAAYLVTFVFLRRYKLEPLTQQQRLAYSWSDM